MSLSVVINTKDALTGNDEHKFADTLKSIAFADEIIVVDMNSSDRTVEIAKKFTDKIYTFRDVGFVEPARNFAIRKASKDWVLIIDADEILPGTLKDRILQLTQGDATADVYYLPRKNLVFGIWFHSAGWWPDYQLRLFKKGAVVWSDKIHSVPKTKGNTDKLAPREDYAILHYNYQTVEQFIERLNRYTSHEARQRQEGRLSSSAVIDAFNAELMSRLFEHKGLSGGMHGVSLSFLQAFYELVVVLKQWERAGFPEYKSDRRTVRSLQKLSANLDYWLADWHISQSGGLSRLFWKLRRKFRV